MWALCGATGSGRGNAYFVVSLNGGGAPEQSFIWAWHGPPDPFPPRIAATADTVSSNRKMLVSNRLIYLGALSRFGRPPYYIIVMFKTV